MSKVVEQVTVHVTFRQGRKVCKLKKVWRGPSEDLPKVGHEELVTLPDGYRIASYMYEKSLDERHVTGRSVIIPPELSFQVCRRFLLENGWHYDGS